MVWLIGILTTILFVQALLIAGYHRQIGDQVRPYWVKTVRIGGGLSVLCLFLLDWFVFEFNLLGYQLGTVIALSYLILFNGFDTLAILRTKSLASR